MSAPSGWEIVEAAFDRDRLAAMESVFAVGNGYLGLRGAPEEGGPSHDPGVVLNGVHETWPIIYPGAVEFSPRLPAEWSGLRFRLQVRGQLVEVDMQPAGTTYRLLEGRGLPIRHFGEPLRLMPDTPLHRPSTPDRQLPRAA